MTTQTLSSFYKQISCKCKSTVSRGCLSPADPCTAEWHSVLQIQNNVNDHQWYKSLFLMLNEILDPWIWSIRISFCFLQLDNHYSHNAFCSDIFMTLQVCTIICKAIMRRKACVCFLLKCFFFHKQARNRNKTEGELKYRLHTFRGLSLFKELQITKELRGLRTVTANGGQPLIQSQPIVTADSMLSACGKEHSSKSFYECRSRSWHDQI